MAQPEIWDLSYRTNQEGIFLPFEYISNFVAGEALRIERTLRNIPFTVITAVTFTVKPTKGSDVILASKTVNSALTVDGVLDDTSISGTGDVFDVQINFRPDETVKFDHKVYFIAEAVTAGGAYPVMISQGYMQGEDLQLRSDGSGIAQIIILNVPGSMGIGQLQILAEAVDSIGNVIPGVEILFFSSDPTVATIDNTGLLTAKANGNVFITAATTQGNISKRATLEIT